MKKILFIIREERRIENSPFIEEAKKMKIGFDLISYEDIHLEFDKNNFQIYIAGKKLMDEYSLVYLRNAWRNMEIATAILEYCLVNKIPVIDPVFTQITPWIDRKTFEYIKLNESGLPIIESFFVSLETLENVRNKLSYPCVAKLTDSSQGEGVFLIQDKEEIKTTIKREKRHLMIQKFIKNDGDYRFFVVGEQVVATMKRIAVNKDEFRNNVSLGGKTEIYQATQEEKELAVAAVKALNYSIAGVDLVKDLTSQKIYIMEVNRSPQFAGISQLTGINIPQKILEYCISYPKNI
jgi:RimK family alpha-L-glutamate ligase